MELNIPGEYLKQGDFEKGEEKVLTISGGQMETVGNGEDADNRPVLSFSDSDSKLVLNKTNIQLIFLAHGATNTDELKGKKITLYVDQTVAYAGKIVGGIRVRPTNPDDDLPI